MVSVSDLLRFQLLTLQQAKSEIIEVVKQELIGRWITVAEDNGDLCC